MTAVQGQQGTDDDDRVFDDAEALITMAQRSFTKAARDAVAENDRLGIPTHGAIGDSLVVCGPRRKGKASDRR